LRDVLDNSVLTKEWRVADVMRVKFRLYTVLKAQGRLDEAGELLAEMEDYLVNRRGNLPKGKQWTDKEDMELLDGDIVTLDHGRTAGIWSNGEFWSYLGPLRDLGYTYEGNIFDFTIDVAVVI
jgi:hypothetical protein